MESFWNHRVSKKTYNGGTQVNEKMNWRREKCRPVP
jgi:hypothetical protein